jgi:Beta-xylosidase
MKISSKLLLALLFITTFTNVSAWEGMSMPRLHIDGRYLKDTHGNVVNLHGFAQTYSPWFNEMGSKWNNYNVGACLSYNKSTLDGVMNAGWKASFLRLHMDPYWSNEPGCTPDYHEAHNCFSETRFRKYLDEVFIPMAEYAIGKGLYVIMRPPGVSPERIAVGDNYNEYLIKVWNIVSQHPKLKNHPNIMFELANEPINILGPNGDYGSGSQGHFDNLKVYFQSMVDVIRANGSHNILWVPGLGYQSLYKGYAVNPIEGENIGYAVHIYPGWFGSANGYENFQREWDINVKPVADFAPIVVTEMDWADEKYDASWGKGHTGTAGGSGFGANFKKIADESGNVSWLIFTEPHRMAQFTGIPPAEGQPYTFLNDPEACPLPTFQWYEEYAQVDYPRPDFRNQSHSDNGDGTYTNPLIHADFPDPDVIRVGDVYYMVSTTMHIFPGATLLKSYDLVNWEYCCNPLEFIESNDAYNLLNGENRYAGGQWASSLRYHNGKYYILFCTLAEGGYLLTATKPEGSWNLKRLSKGYYDPGLHFDENGKIYVVHGINNLTITELDQDFNAVAGSEKIVVERPDKGLEGSHLYKIGNYYYIYATYGGWPASQTVFRSGNIYGPYEEKRLMDEENIHQGALVETQTGEWWTVLFYDKGPYGRLPNLQPVTWKDNWPALGVEGKAVTTYKKPNVGKEYIVKALPTNDNFRNYKLGMQWGWNHNPDNSKWSLFEKPGYLRLKTTGVVPDFLQARNTLTQRIFGYHSSTKDSYGTICMDVSEMKEGDIAGLAVFQDPYSFIGITITDGVKNLIWKNSKTGNMQNAPIAISSKIYLRAVANYGTGKAKFYYSTDNVVYTPFGEEFVMEYNLSVFVGNRFSIFNYATKQAGGYIDVDWFSTEEQFSEELFYDDSFTGYKEEEITIDEIFADSDLFEMMIGTSRTLQLTARFIDGHSENITTKATYSVSSPDVVSIVNGQAISHKEGNAMITAIYEDLLGNEVSTTFSVAVKVFPFTAGLFNPSIFSTGVYDENTRTITTGQYGAAGWWYNNGVDISSYKYLVAELDEVQNCGTQLRIFDENNYWTSCASYSFGNQKRVIVTLNDMIKNEGSDIGKTCNPSNVFIICFWSYGGSPININNVYLTNSDNYENPNNIEIVIPDRNELVDVYTVTGIKLRSNIIRNEATRGLPRGIYIVGGKKEIIIK